MRWEHDHADDPEDFYGEGSVQRWSAQMQPDLTALESRLRAGGRVTRSDTNGRVSLPGEEFPSVLGRKGALLGGTESLSSDENNVTSLHLWPDGDVCVRVLDSSGAPLAATGVMLVASGLNYKYPSAAQRVVTNADGLATLQHAWVKVASGAASQGECNQSWRVAVEMIPDATVFRELDPAALSREPITLRMPPSGEVEIELRESDGSLASINLPLVLQEIDEQNSPHDPPDERQRRIVDSQGTDELRTTLADGRAVFKNVGLGLRLIAYASRNEPSRVSVIRFAGPTKAGERMRVSMTLGVESVTLTGCVKGPDGNALSEERLRVELYGAPSPERDPFGNVPDGKAVNGESGTLVTNASGQFSVEFAMDAAFHGRPVLVLAHKRSDGVVLETSFDLQDVWSAGAHDLGNIHIAEAPVMAAGVVVDESGAPIAGAWLANARGGLQNVHDFQTNARGEFVWHSAEPHERVDLLVSKDGFTSTCPNEGEAGRTNWRIVLRRSTD
ncbi:MAG: carboxypeptidase-like regulatory domain-containing protein [Planctomycetota bacterium]